MKTKQRVEVAILMSTYNGEQYLEELIESLLSQSYNKWILFIHDDGSTDKTKSIINSYSNLYSNILLIELPERLGAKESFMRMLMDVDANYFFFCDQDDVWNENKIERTLKVMKELEAKHFQAPILVHSDLEVTDNKLETISPSFWKQSGINNRLSFNRLGVHNSITGCTMMINHYAKDVVVYPAPNATMHDVWIALCVAKANGIIYGIKESLIKYRQHSRNTLGAVSSQKHSLLFKLCSIDTVVRNNKLTYKMLKDLGYGSPFKYIYFKFLTILGL